MRRLLHEGETNQSMSMVHGLVAEVSRRVRYPLFLVQYIHNPIFVHRQLNVDEELPRKLEIGQTMSCSWQSASPHPPVSHRQERLPVDMFSPKPFTSAGPPPPTFIGLVFALSGWALIEATLLSQHAGLRGHLVPTVMALYLVSSSIRRLKLSQQLTLGQAGSPAPQGGSPAAAQAGWALFLLVAGAFTGSLVLGGSPILLGLAASALTCAPWSRIPFCRERTVAASAVMCAGMGLSLLAPLRPIDPIFLLIAGWMFWLCATFAIVGRIARLWRAERDVKAAARAASTQTA
jgi:hypothetical protein